MKYASKFTKLPNSIPELMSSKGLKIRKFKEGLAFYNHSQLAGQPMHTY